MKSRCCAFAKRPSSTASTPPATIFKSYWCCRKALPRALAATRHRAAERTSVRFTIAELERLVDRIVKAAKTGQPIVPADYYPELKKSDGKTRELPLADDGLANALARYLNHRSALPKPLTPNAPLVLSQRGGPYSPNTLQDHIATLLRAWAGIERATSHSGRRTLATKLLHEQGEHQQPTRMTCDQ